MSILIKGMEMPIMPDHLLHEEDVPYIDVRIFADGKTVKSKGTRPYYDEFPVFELPTPHGRLIDADALREDWLENGENEYVYDTNSFLESIDIAPTIIEAEGGGEGGN